MFNQRIQNHGCQVLWNHQHILHRSFLMEWNHHQQIDFISKYQHVNVHVFMMFFYYSNNSVKEDIDNEKKKCSKPALISVGVLLSVVTLTALAINIYLLIYINKATSTSNNKAHIILIEMEDLSIREELHLSFLFYDIDEN